MPKRTTEVQRTGVTVFIEELHFTSIILCFEHWAWCMILSSCFFAISNVCHLHGGDNNGCFIQLGHSPWKSGNRTGIKRIGISFFLFVSTNFW